MKWGGMLTSIEILEEKREGVGSRVKASLGKMQFIMEVTEYVENAKIASRAVAGDLKELDLSFTFEATGETTRLTYTIHYVVPKVLGGRIFDSLMVRKTTEEEMEKGLQRLKNLLERDSLIVDRAVDRKEKRL